MLNIEKLEPYYSNQFEIEFFGGYQLLTEQVISYKIEDRIIWIDLGVSQGKFIENYEGLKSTNEIRIKHFDRVGNVYLELQGLVDFINTSGFGGNYNETNCMEMKVSYVFKGLSVTEDGRYGEFGHPQTIKLF